MAPHPGRLDCENAEIACNEKNASEMTERKERTSIFRVQPKRACSKRQRALRGTGLSNRPKEQPVFPGRATAVESPLLAAKLESASGSVSFSLSRSRRGSLASLPARS